MSVTIQEALAEYNAKQESERLAMCAGANMAPAGAMLNHVTPSAPDGRYLREEMIRIVAQGVKFDAPEDMIAAAEAIGVYVLLGKSPEQPEQPSTETMAPEIEGAPAPLPVEPMADLSGSADEVLASNGVYDVGDRTYAFGAEISNGSVETD
jgi:hypothetical protein